MKNFKDRLKDLREQRALSQKALADKLDVNKQTISQYERGVRKPDLDMLSVLCDFFNVSSDYMLGKTDVTPRFLNSDDLALLDGGPLNGDEIKIVVAYRKASEGRKDAVRALLNMGGE